MITKTINVIAKGFARGSITKPARKKNLQEVLYLSIEKMKKIHMPLSNPKIFFSSFNFEGIILGHDDPMVISAVMVNAEIKRVFVAQGSPLDITF